MTQQTQLATQTLDAAPTRRLAYLPGIDGLRAVAVLAVMCFHANSYWMPGGFLGVEVFFVISGYLITTLLLGEWQQHGTVDFKTFWIRRLRRLFPAMAAVIVGVLTFVVLFLPDEVANLRDDALASLLYLSNWYLIFEQRAYFETVGRPPLLQHLWSLAIEAQFYLVWPLLFVAGMRRWSRRTMLGAIVVAAAASSALMAWLYSPTVDPSRLYYGTDTRAAALLIGAALAFFWAPGQVQQELTARGVRFLDLASGVALIGLGYAFFTVNGFQSELYRGGFALLSLLTAIVIAAVVHPGTFVGQRLLSWGPLCWIGTRSYSLYLWHWPVFMLTRPQLDVAFDGLALLALRLVLAFGLAELSYRYIETPIRRGALERSWQTYRSAQGDQQRRLRWYWGGSALVGALFLVVLGTSAARARPPETPDYLAVEAIRITPVPPTATATAAPTAVLPTPTPTTAPPQVVAQVATMAAIRPTAARAKPPTPTLEPTPEPTPEPTLNRDYVVAIGDSVMLGAAMELALRIPVLDIDGAVGRHASEVPAILRERRANGQMSDVVVIHIGSNGTYTTEQFDAIMAELSDVPRVLMMNVKVPREWEASNNAVIQEGVQRYPNAYLIDWYGLSVGRPDFFRADGYHLVPPGAVAYIDLLEEHIYAP